MEVDLCTILNRHNNMASSEQKTNPGKMERQLDVKSQTLCNGDRKSNIATSVISVNSSSPSLVNKKSNANTYICRPHLQQKCDICTTGDCSQKDDLQDITDSVSVGSFHNKTEQDFNNQSCELSKNQKTDGNCDGELVHAFDTKTALSPDKDNKMIKASDSASFLSCSPTPAKPGSDDPQIDSPTDNSADSNTADHLDKFDSLWTNHSCTDERSENSNCTQQSCDSFEGKSEFNKEGTIDDSRAVEDQLKDQPPVGMQSAICNYHKNTDSHSQNLAATKNTGCSVCFQNQIICSSSADVSFTCTSPKHQVKSFNNEARQYSHSQSEVTVSQLMSEIPSTMSTSTGTESDIRVKSSEHSSSTANSNNEEPPEQTIKQANWGAGSETCDRSDTAESAFDFNPKINSNIDGRYNPHSNTNTAFRYCPTLNSSMNYRNFFSPLFEDKLHLETTKTETSRINTGSFNHNNKTMNDVNNDIQLSEKSTWVQTDSGNDGHEASLTEREKTSDSNRKRDCEKEIQQGNVTEVENERMPGVRVGSVEARGGNSRPLALSFMSLLPHQSVHIRSNNSTKNLKCPWCNWHYKYKETLDAHVREKHEGCTYDPSKDRDSQGPQSDCRYCMSGNDHPLLGQGEVHVCGFKPYHCAACDYSTNSKGNLIIHTQSDKHLVRMQDLQLQQGGLDSKEGLLSQSEGRLGISRRVGKMGHIKGVLNFRSNFPQNLPFQMMGSKNLSRVFLNLGYPRGLVGQLTVPPQLNYKYYSLNLLKTQDKDSQQKLSNESENPVHYKQEKGNKLDEQMEERRHGEEHEKTEEEVQENKEEHVVEQNHKQEDNTNKLASSKEEYKVASPPAAIFQCLVCLSFTTNQLPLLLHHSLPSQHSSDSDTWWRDFSPESSSHLCLLCQYSTPLSANFGLHIKTGRHCSRLAVAQHLRKHGIDFEGRLGLPGPPPPLVHLSCRACQYQSQSFAAMKQHAKTTAHEQAVLKYQHTFSISLQGQLSDHHIRQPEIITAPNGVKSPKPGIDNNGEEHVTDGDSVTEFCCPLCGFSSPSSEQVQEHLASQHAVQGLWRCPLCQVDMNEQKGLIEHLQNQHSVIQSCLARLVQAAMKVDIKISRRVNHCESESDTREEGCTFKEPIDSDGDSNVSGKSPSEQKEPSSCNEVKNKITNELSHICETGDEKKESASPRSEPASQQKDDQFRKNTSSLDPLDSESSPQEGKAQEEKESSVCQTEDSNDKTVVQPPLESCPEVSESSDIDGIADKCTADFQSGPLPLIGHQRNTNLAMEKFLDPTRPYKCDICQESFTQKSILIVHFNSVSHLNRVKKTSSGSCTPPTISLPAKETTTSISPPISFSQQPSMNPVNTLQGVEKTSPSPSSDKPYRCTTCHVAYSQSLTLENHMRSVLHYSRSRGSNNNVSNCLKDQSSSSPPAKDKALSKQTVVQSIEETVTAPPVYLSPPSSAMPLPCLMPQTGLGPLLVPQLPLLQPTLVHPDSMHQQVLLPLFLNSLNKLGGIRGMLPPPLSLLGLNLQASHLQAMMQHLGQHQPTQSVQNLHNVYPLLNESCGKPGKTLKEETQQGHEKTLCPTDLSKHSCKPQKTGKQDDKDKTLKLNLSERLEAKDLFDGLLPASIDLRKEEQHHQQPINLTKHGNTHQAQRNLSKMETSEDQTVRECEGERDHNDSSPGEGAKRGTEGQKQDPLTTAKQEAAHQYRTLLDKHWPQSQELKKYKEEEEEFRKEWLRYNEQQLQKYRLNQLHLKYCRQEDKALDELGSKLLPNQKQQSYDKLECNLTEKCSASLHARRIKNDTGLKELTDFQEEVLWAFLESEKEAASPAKTEDRDALSKVLGLPEEEVIRWLESARKQSVSKSRKAAEGNVAEDKSKKRKKKEIVPETYLCSDEEYDSHDPVAMEHLAGCSEKKIISSNATSLHESINKMVTDKNGTGNKSRGLKCDEIRKSAASRASVLECYVTTEDEEDEGLQGSGNDLTRRGSIQSTEDSESIDDEIEQSLDEHEDENKEKKPLAAGASVTAVKECKSETAKPCLKRDRGGHQGKTDPESSPVKKPKLDSKAAEERNPLSTDLQSKPPGHPISSLNPGLLPALNLPMNPYLSPFMRPCLIPAHVSVLRSPPSSGASLGSPPPLSLFPNKPGFSHPFTSNALSREADAESKVKSKQEQLSVPSLSGKTCTGQVRKANEVSGLSQISQLANVLGKEEEEKKENEKKDEDSNDSDSKLNKMDLPLHTAASFGRYKTILPCTNIKADIDDPEKSSFKKDPSRNSFKDSRRSRTTLLPEQLDVLYGCYYRDSNPAKQELEHISEYVNLEKKVVQIWFQNMRARERKGEVRFFSDGTLAAVGKPLIRFTWPPADLIPLKAKDHDSLRHKGQRLYFTRPVPAEREGAAHSTSNKAVPHSSQMTSGTSADPGKNDGKDLDAEKGASYQPKQSASLNDQLRGQIVPAQKKFEESKEGESNPNTDDKADVPSAAPGKTEGTTSVKPTCLSISEREKSGDDQGECEPMDYSLPSDTLGPSKALQADSHIKPYLTCLQEKRDGLMKEGEAKQMPHVQAQAQNQRRRFRTHLSCLQLKMLQSCYDVCRTPTAQECRDLGEEIGLPQKVVQIWFQNARAKERRCRSQQMGGGGFQSRETNEFFKLQCLNGLRTNRPILPRPASSRLQYPNPVSTLPDNVETECLLCHVVFGVQGSSRVHTFSKMHLTKLKQLNCGELTHDTEEPSLVHTPHPSPPELPTVHQSSEEPSLNLPAASASPVVKSPVQLESHES
ncbi:zinc finger homeobox protein 3 [Polypterus senegalus]|uniref:zinc finger homeobox protein 3 n=1 Tax=Polypterus senegalus TaxID=55291 RepID=UPI001964AB70|nr:zinc finger homeobox protein 3 [Polypterus senegalus]